MSRVQALGLVLLVSASAASTARADDSRAGPLVPDAAELRIPLEKLTLANGLVVILAEDHTVPMVAVNTIVKVGSRFEPKGRTGFAHLFEHLMFMGTERVPTGMFDQLMESAGGGNNAWTSEDRTNYYDVGPAHLLPLLLWLEADRLSALGASISQPKLDAQRGVVRNERRETSENEPYGKVELRLPELLYAEGHPYHHPVIGSHEDLEAANVGDVGKFFSDFYVANNMSLVVAGDFDRAATKAEVERLFGVLRTSAVPDAPKAAAPKLTGVVRETIEDRVELAKVVIAWHSPARFSPGDAELDILGNVLAHGKTSRLYKSVVYDKELAQSVEAVQISQDLSSYFQVEAIGRPGVPLDKLEEAIIAAVREVQDKGITPAELLRAKNDYETSFVRQLESVHRRASLLNSYETYVGDPGFIGRDLERYRRVDVDGVRAAARASLDPNARVVIRVVPALADAAKPSPDAKKGGGQ